MATTYNTAFGSLPGYNEMLGTTNTTGGGQQQVYGQRAQQQRQQQQQPAPAQTFSQMQQRGMARPAPPSAPQAQPFAQYGGSQQAQQMRQRLQEQLQQFGQTPSRFDTQAFQQIRGAQAANLQQEYRGQLQALNEELARRGLSASSVGGGRMGDLAGQQARALASLDAELLQRAAETQAQDRAQLLSEGRGLAELASSQDLAQFEANRVAQAATFENQLRAAQFGQQQFEQAGQEAFQGAQAEEAAQQAARAFDLQATGQAAGLSMDLQRLLGQQEIERAQLTGQLGGAQTLAGREFEERQRQFNIQQELQEQLGLGGLGVQQEQLGLERERLTQQRDDSAAERALRETMQTRELTSQEKQQLADIDARKALQTQQITEQGRQFGLDLKEREAARLQQGGFTTTELALKRQQVDNELAIQNRQLSETERNNLAIQGLQRDQFNADKDFRSQQLGLNRDELNQRASQIQEDQRLRGVEIDDQRAYRNAEIEARTTQIQNEFARSGQQIDVDRARIQAQKDLAAVDNAAQWDRLNRQLGVQVSESALQRQEQARQFNLEQSLRQALGLTEATGRLYAPIATGASVGTEELKGAPPTLATRQQAIQQAQMMSQMTGQEFTIDDQGRVVRGTAQTEARRQFNLEQSLRQALGLTEATGVLYAPEETGAGVTTKELGRQTIASRQQAVQQAQALSAITGKSYTVDSSGKVVEGTADTEERRQFEAQQREQARQFNLDNSLRQALGLTELTGYLYAPVQTGTSVGTNRLGEQTVGREAASAQQRLAAAEQLLTLQKLQADLIAALNATKTTTGSDIRLKDNVIPAAEAGKLLDAITVVSYDWKDSGDHVAHGVIAQDLHKVVPEAVNPGDDGETIAQMWTVDLAKLVPLLVKEVQSLRQRVAALEED